MLLETVEKILDSCFACIPRAKPESQKFQNTRLIAHRGAHDKRLGIRENTHEAFKRARDLGCWGIEFDIHPTADGVLVVNHDPTLLRLWGHDVAIRNISFSALRNLVPQIPSLAEVVGEYGGQLHLFVELKAPFSAEEALVSALASLKSGEDYHVISLDETVFAKMTRIQREHLLLVAVHNNVEQFCQLSLNKGYGGVLGHYLLFTSPNIDRLKSVNQLVGVGFVDSKNSLYREINRDIPWLFTNNVGRVSQYL